MRQRSILAFAVLLIVLDLLLIARTVSGNPYWYDTTDVGLYLKAAEALTTGASPYAIRTEVDRVEHAYAYSPVFAFVLAFPLMLFGREATHLLWMVLVLGCISGTLVLLLRGFGPPLPWRWVLLIIGVAGLTRLVRSEVYHGQADLPVVFLIVLGLYALSRSRDLAAGACLGLVITVKPFLGVLVLWMLWRGMRRPALVALATGGSLLLLSFAATGTRALSMFMEWQASSRYIVTVPFVSYLDNHSLYGLATRAFTETPFSEPWIHSPELRIATIAVAITSVLIVAVMAVPYATSRPPRFENRWMLLSEAGAVLALTMAIGPLLEGGYLLYLLPALVGTVRLAVSDETEHRQSWTWAAAAWGILAVGMLSPVQFGTLTETPALPHIVTGLTILLTWRVGALVLVAGLLTLRALATSAETVVSVRTNSTWTVKLLLQCLVGTQFRGTQHVPELPMQKSNQAGSGVTTSA